MIRIYEVSIQSHILYPMEQIHFYSNELIYYRFTTLLQEILVFDMIIKAK
jgi:hypothetical protein